MQPERWAAAIDGVRSALHAAGKNSNEALAVAEASRLRAASQAGFRPGLSVLHQGFALQQLIDRQKRRGQPLYVCQLDLQGAYDRVSRPLLWQVLARLGVQGRMLAAIQGLYASASIAINVGGRHGPVLPSRTGVRQGCPLSPTLFGLFADGLHRFLQHTCMAHAVHIAGLAVTDLAYADDMALVSRTPAALQSLIDAAAAWCAAVGMRLAPAKTKCIELTGLAVEPCVFTCAGQELQLVAEIRYLRVFFAPGAGLAPTCGKVMQKMRAAWALLRRRYERLDCAQSVWLQLQLCRACVVSAGSFASELWGVYPFGDQAQRKACKAVAALHLRVVKRIAGLRVTTSTDVVYRELELLPLQHEWLVSAARFFNTLRSGTGLHASLLRDCIQLAREGGCCWVLGLKRGLQAVGYQSSLEVARVPAIDLPCLRSKIQARMALVWVGLPACPRQAPSAGVKNCIYLRYFARPAGCSSSVLSLSLSARVVRQFLRFRAGCHGLPIDAGRMSSVPRQERLCALCAGGVGDEQHLVFECEALQDLRARFAGLFQGVSTLSQFVWQEPLGQVAVFVDKCLRRALQA